MLIVNTLKYSFQTKQLIGDYIFSTVISLKFQERMLLVQTSLIDLGRRVHDLYAHCIFTTKVRSHGPY